jgi:signal transduction histidine kinase
LLDRARPRSLAPKPTSLTVLTQKAVNIARSAAVSAGATGRRVFVEFEAPAEDVVLNADSAQIEDAVLNLILNSIEAIEREGRITIRIRREDGDENVEAVIEVSDTGRGISEEDLARVFNPFFTTTKGGTGLGLPAVRRIARAHGGRVEAESQMGEGATFRIRLPVNGSR